MVALCVTETKAYFPDADLGFCDAI